MTSKRTLGRNGARALTIAALGCSALACAGLAACSSDDAVATHGSQTTGSADATADGAQTGGNEAGLPTGVPLCGKYGGFAFVSKLADDVNAKMGADCRVSAHFTALDQGSAQHMKECTEQLFGTYFQCEGIAYAKDSKGNTCRSLQESHRNMNLRTDDFQAALDDIITVMKDAKMSDDDISAIAPTFIGIQGQIANKTGKGNSTCTCSGMIYDGGYCGIEAGTTIDAGDGGGGGKDAQTDATGGNDAGGGTDASDAGQTIQDAADGG